MSDTSLPIARLKQELAEHADVVQRMAATHEAFEQLAQRAIQSLEQGGKILWFGNGGSAADAQHLSTELAVRFRRNRQALASIALTTDTSALTAIGNDFGFDDLFSRQVEALAHAGDVVIGITTSGRSANVLAGLRAARAAGAVTVALTGERGLENCEADIVLAVPSPDTARIQEMHITLGHAFCAVLDERFA